MSTGRVIVLVTLKPRQDAAKYESWVRATDLPIVRRLGSIADFRVYRATGLLGGGIAPYDYIEVLDIADGGQFEIDSASEVVRRVADEFAGWADAVFITTSEIISS